MCGNGGMIKYVPNSSLWIPKLVHLSPKKTKQKQSPDPLPLWMKECEYILVCKVKWLSLGPWIFGTWLLLRKVTICIIGDLSVFLTWTRFISVGPSPKGWQPNGWPAIGRCPLRDRRHDQLYLRTTSPAYICVCVLTHIHTHTWYIVAVGFLSMCGYN